MVRAKLCAFTIACIVGTVGLGPVTAFAADEAGSVSISQANENQKDKYSAFKEKMQKAKESWDSLSAGQKNEVYALLEKSMKSEMKLIDKLTELGVVQKEDAVFLKNNMSEKFNKIKESGEFPLLRQKAQKSR